MSMMLPFFIMNNMLSLEKEEAAESDLTVTLGGGFIYLGN